MISCKAGQLNTNAKTPHGESVLDVGIINAGQSSNDYCLNSAFYDPFNCTQYLNTELLMTELAKYNGKNEAHIGELTTDKFKLTNHITKEA